MSDLRENNLVPSWARLHGLLVGRQQLQGVYSKVCMKVLLLLAGCEALQLAEVIMCSQADDPAL